MLVVVNQPHTEGFRIEGDIPKDVLDYIEKKYSKKDISIMDDEGEELIDPTELDFFKNFKSRETPGGNLRFYRKFVGMTQKDSKAACVEHGKKRESHQQEDREGAATLVESTSSLAIQKLIKTLDLSDVDIFDLSGLQNRSFSNCSSLESVIFPSNLDTSTSNVTNISNVFYN